MNILIAPDKFKGTLSATAFCLAAEKGLKKHRPDLRLISLPLSDGGEGFLEVIAQTGDYLHEIAFVQDPLGRQIEASYKRSVDGSRMVIEVARIIGLQLLLKHEYNCMAMSTLGLGQLLANTMQEGLQEILIGVGGTATTDGGTGMAHAIGYAFQDKNDRSFMPNGSTLHQVRRIIPPKKLLTQHTKVIGLCDVTNPMFGLQGAAHVFAGQKGADEDDIKVLDDGLQNLSFMIERDLDVKVGDIPGSGAGGALGAGIVAFLGGELRSGANFILDITGFNQYLLSADLVITGEGKLDEQSKSGKLCYVVGQKCKSLGKKVIAIVGTNRWADPDCFDCIFSLEAEAGGQMDPFEDAAMLVEQLSAKAIGKVLN